MNKNIFKLLTLIALSWSTSSVAYIQNRTQADGLIQWSNRINSLDIFVNPSNSQMISSEEVNAIVADSLNQWNGKSKILLKQNLSSSINTDGVNEIYFSSDPSVFGNGTAVVAVTQVVLKNYSGEIIEADIMINDNATFSKTKKSTDFLGNVISHELGHFLGLGHGQVPGSTMFYTLSRGQSELADDDMAGIYSIYPTPGVASKGSISGRVVGGKSLTGVFGAHVQAISLKTGKVAAASISERDGTFSVKGLEKNDQYFIYTKPISIIGLPSKYNNSRSDYCDSSKKYRGSFFQACGTSGEGYPQSINLNSSNVSVGNITIRCGLDVPKEYLKNKDSTYPAFDMHSGVESGIGNSFVGFFTARDVENEINDIFKINYSEVDWNKISVSNNLYLELKILNQSFYSPFKANVVVKRRGEVIASTPNYVEESDGSLNLEKIVRIKIDSIGRNSSDNDFEISVLPQTLASLPYPKKDFFPAETYFEDSVYFYLVTASIVEKTAEDTYSHISYKNEVIKDNSSCPDAENTYALTKYNSEGPPNVTPAKKKEKGLACGSVDMNSSSGSGPGGFFIGLIFSLFLCSLTTSIIKQYKSKHYSKLA